MQTKPKTPHGSPEPSGNLDSGFFSELVGLTTGFSKQNADKTPSGSLVPIEPDFDPSESPEGVHEQRTQIPFHKQGKVKTALLGALVAMPMGGLGFMLFGGGEKPAEVAKQAEPVATPPPKAEFAQDPRFGIVQSKLAMQDQEKMLTDAAAKQEQDRLAKVAAAGASPTNPGAATTLPPSQTATKPTVAPTTAQTAEPSPPTNVEPPPKTEPAIVPKSYPKPDSVAIVPKPEPQKVPQAPVIKTPVIKPQPPTVAAKPAIVKQKLIASRAEVTNPIAPMPRAASPSYRPASPTVQPTQVSWQQATNSGIGVFGAKNASAGTANPTAQALVIPGSAPQPTSPNISQTRSSRKIIAGQNRAVSLISPMQILANEQGQEVLIQVDEGFVDSAGGISIPAGTRIIADVTVASNGLLRITTAKALINNDEISISTGSLILTGTNNAPVFAQLKQFGQDEIGRRDMQTFLAGAVQGIGDVLTQPDTQTQIAANGTAISSTTNKRDYIGGILKGGGTPILQQWAQRNQAEVQRLEGATRLWHLPVGFKMSLVAVRPFSVK
jgi:hypothetical protein